MEFQNNYNGINKGHWYIKDSDKDNHFKKLYEVLYILLDDENDEGVVDGELYIDVFCREHYFDSRTSTGVKIGVKYDDFKKFFTNERKAKLDEINKSND